MRVPLVPGLRGSSAHWLLPMDLASCRDLPSGLPHSSILANVGARSTRTLDAVDVDTLADVAKLRRHPGHSLLRLVVVGDDVLEGRTSDENQLTTTNTIHDCIIRRIDIDLSNRMKNLTKINILLVVIVFY